MLDRQGNFFFAFEKFWQVVGRTDVRYVWSGSFLNKDTENLVSKGEQSRENDCARPESQLRMSQYCQKKSVNR